VRHFRKAGRAFRVFDTEVIDEAADGAAGLACLLTMDGVGLWLVYGAVSKWDAYCLVSMACFVKPAMQTEDYAGRYAMWTDG